MVKYTVKQLAKIANISVRTLHLYDKMRLIIPAERTAAGYRIYGERELLLLQQVLLYKEMDMPLQQIKSILYREDFDIIEALISYKNMITARRKRMLGILDTINKTIDHLKTNNMKNFEDLYGGFSKQEATALHNETIDKYGREVTEQSEKHLLSLGAANLEALKQEQIAITDALVKLMSYNPESPEVQFEIARHYQNIRSFWGTQHSADLQAKQYAGLGELYVADERFIKVNGKSNPAFALFMSKAMKHYAQKL